jgi:ribosomal subunit interface protein
MELTEAISAYVHKKVDVLERFIEPDVQALAEIEIGKTTQHHHKGDVFKAEINLTIGKDNFQNVVIESDLYAAIDRMKDNVVNEVKRSKRKKLHLFRRGHQKIKDILRNFSKSA